MRQQFMWTKWGLWLVLAAAVTEPVGAADDVWTGGRQRALGQECQLEPRAPAGRVGQGHQRGPGRW